MLQILGIDEIEKVVLKRFVHFKMNDVGRS
jgi:hypothetical protein